MYAGLVRAVSRDPWTGQKSYVDLKTTKEVYPSMDCLASLTAEISRSRFGKSRDIPGLSNPRILKSRFSQSRDIPEFEIQLCNHRISKSRFSQLRNIPEFEIQL